MRVSNALPYVMVAALAASMSVALADNSSAGSAPNVMVDVKQLNKDTEKFLGQQVMTTGKIERLEGTNAFVLKSPGILSSDILVVIDRSQAPQGGKQQAGTAAPVLKKGEKVQVKGRVEELAIERIEERYKPGLETELREELQQKQPILVVPPNGIQAQG